MEDTWVDYSTNSRGYDVSLSKEVLLISRFILLIGCYSEKKNMFAEPIYIYSNEH